MDFGICNLSIIPCRAEPNDKAEMVTQLIFGEHYTVVKKEKKWVKIKSYYDNYESWICIKQFYNISKDEFNKISRSKINVVSKKYTFLRDNSSTTLLPLGSILPNFSNNNLEINNTVFEYKEDISTNKFNNLKHFAMLYLNTPYLWGGRTEFGIDCSGFTQLVYRLCGIIIPRDAYQQANEGETISFVENTKIGDLAFFDNEEGNITHVGIILENNKIIHSSGFVRIDILDHHGIYDKYLECYTHKLRIIKRYN